MMMEKITVYKDRQGDWVMECEHDTIYCSDWALAYEAAVGHACMEHPRRPEWETATHWTGTAWTTRPATPVIFR